MKPTNLLVLGLGLLLPAQPDLRAQSVPHYFRDITAPPDHTITLSLGGSVSSLFASFCDLYVIEASANLTDWMPLATLVRTNAHTNTLVFTDTPAAPLDRRFYRTFTNHLITPFPKPTGPYAVGTFSRLVTDPSRTNRLRIKGSSHMWFTDAAWIAAPSTATRRAALAMDACTLSFFNHYLKDQDDHGFEASNGQPPPIQQAYPEIIELRSQ